MFVLQNLLHFPYDFNESPKCVANNVEAISFDTLIFVMKNISGWNAVVRKDCIF